MKRIEAITQVTSELIRLRDSLNEGLGVSPLSFMNLSEVFKFGIEPKSDRFTAICLDEASKTDDKEKHLQIINDILGELDSEDIEDEEETSEVNELLDYDGSVQSSKIPPGVENVKSLSSRKTTDDVVKGTRQGGTWNRSSHYFRRYYSESIEDIKEIDKSGILGVEETDQLSFDDAVDYYQEELEIPKDEAVERVEKERGPETLEKDKVDGSFTRHRLTEKEKLKKIAEDKVRNMIEVILADNSDSGELTEKETSMLTRKIKNLVRFAKTQGVKNLGELTDMIKSDWDE